MAALSEQVGAALARRWAGDVVQMTPENWFGDAKSGQTATEAI
jgi:hypothetical protein